MHRLLSRQLKRHLDPSLQEDARLQALLDAVNHYYTEVDKERLLLENALQLSSQELTEAVAVAQREHMLLRGVMDSIPDLIFFKNAEGQFLGCNKAFERQFGLTEANVIGKTDFELMSSALANEMAVQDHAVLSTGRERLTERWVTPSTSAIPVCLEILRTPYFDPAGKVKGLIGIGRDITERKQSEETILHLANYDSLTDLANRRHFSERLLQEIQQSNRSHLPLALMLIDLDKFKQVNDVLGHDAGDMLLVEVSKRLKASVRETDIVARLGGDEFTVLLTHVTNINHVEQIAQKLVDRLAEPFQLGDQPASISGSIGIATYPDNGEDAETLTKAADQAMYFAKSTGRNRFSFFTPALQESASQRRQLLQGMPVGLRDNQFFVCFQPIFDLQTGKAVKFEALLRWMHPERGLIPPCEFIPLAEDSGDMVALGEFVFREAVALAKRLRALGHNDMQVCVNKSPAQFKGRYDLAASWVSYLKEQGLSGDALEVEISEGLLLKSDDITQARLETLRQAGMSVSLDDFGSGYASIAHLKRRDINNVKIDRPLIAALESDKETLALCEALIIMAHKLGLRVVAEGVETEGQRQLLRQAGCDFAQGFLMGKPVPVEFLEPYLLP